MDGKDYLADYATRFVKDGIIVGLGSGSTAERFIVYLAEWCRINKEINSAVASLKK